MLQPKDPDWLNGYKNKSDIYIYIYIYVYIYIYMLSIRNPTHFRPKDTYRLKVRGWKNIFHANGKQKKVAAASSYQTK